MLVDSRSHVENALPSKAARYSIMSSSTAGFFAPDRNSPRLLLGASAKSRQAGVPFVINSTEVPAIQKARRSLKTAARRDRRERRTSGSGGRDAARFVRGVSLKHTS